MSTPVKSHQFGNLPSAEEMRKFADRFDDAEWAKLCTSKRFMHLVTHDLNACAPLAERILAGKEGKTPKSIDAAKLRENPDAWRTEL